MLLPKAILEAERAADAPFREAMAIKRERLRTIRAERNKLRVARESLRPLRAKKKKRQ
jgi:hypothetical protein